MITMLPSGHDRVMAFHLSGTLSDQDYKSFVPAVESGLEKAEGKIRMLALLEDFHGWTPRAVWDDIVFSTRHCGDLERIAMVGDRSWERWMALICKPFTLAKVRYFDTADEAAAWGWIREGLEPPAPRR